MARASSGMDLNGQIAALLRDFAAIQKTKQSMWGYKRAASAVLALEEPIASFLQADGTLRKIPNIGPSSTRVIVEVLQDTRCIELMRDFIRKNSSLWNEDIGT